MFYSTILLTRLGFRLKFQVLIDIVFISPLRVSLSPFAPQKIKKSRSETRPNIPPVFHRLLFCHCPAAAVIHPGC